MFRNRFTALALALVLAGAAVAQAIPPQFPPRPPIAGPQVGDISGEYFNASNGRYCTVEARGRNYLFVNENGTPARFVFTGPNRLEMIGGGWQPGTIVTVEVDRVGRMALRFDSPGQPPGYWLPAWR